MSDLRGDMSLGARRPEHPPESSSSSVSTSTARASVIASNAGIRGWARVNALRGRTALADRAEPDNFDIHNRSLWLDLKILPMTVRAGFRGRGEP